MKTLLIAIVLVSMSFFAVSSMAQSNTTSTPAMPMHDNMTMESAMNHQNMANMGELMMRMGDTLEKHKMTDEQRTACARFINNLSRIMMNCAGDVELKAVDKHKEEVEELTKEWNYFESGNFEEH